MHRRRQRTSEEAIYDIIRWDPARKEIVARYDYSCKGYPAAKATAGRLNDKLSEDERKESPWEPYTPAIMPLAPKVREPSGKCSWPK